MRLKAGSNGSQMFPGFIEATLIALHAEGEENAVKLDFVMKYTGLSSRRYLQKLAEREKLNGAFILSSRRGMFLPDADEEKGYREITRFMRSQERKAKSMLRINGVFRRKLQLPEQTQIVEEPEA